MTADPPRKVFVAPPDGQPITDETALEMGYLLADELLGRQHDEDQSPSPSPSPSADSIQRSRTSPKS